MISDGPRIGAVVITRDRSKYVAAFVPWLVGALRNCQLTCAGVAIVDDSCGEAHRRRVRAMTNEVCHDTPIEHIGRRKQSQLLAAAFPDREAGLFTRPLGLRSVNVGSSRNTGSIYWLLQSRPPDVICYFDDDLLPIAGAQRWLWKAACIANKQDCAVGCTLGGMQDESSLERFRGTMTGQRQRQRVCGQHAYSISGGCVVMSKEMVARIPFSGLYNEDWIFFLEAGAYGFRTTRLPGRAFSQRESKSRLSASRLKREAIGEIAFRALKCAPRGSALLEWIAEHEEAWEDARRSYMDEVQEVVKLARRQRLAEGSIVSSLSVWLARIGIDRVRFDEHKRARRIWSSCFATQ